MPLLTVIVVIIIAGVLLWAANTFLPLDPKIRTILNVVVVVALLLWLVAAFGLLAPFQNVRVGTGNQRVNSGCSLSTVGR